MVENVEVKNFGPISKIQWNKLGKINLIIGKNAVGKTFLLKSIYSAVRSIEQLRGQEQRDIEDILANKLYWTFQTNSLGDLVHKSSKRDNNPLSFSFQIDQKKFSYSFGKDTTKKIKSVQNEIIQRNDNSIFLPAKEVLSLHQAILRSRENDKIFGFDDTYLDLARALQQQTKQGKNFKEFAESRKDLDTLLDGRLAYDPNSNIWIFKKGNQKFSMGILAEGVKKIGILDTLLGNGYLTPGSIVFMDEPESALHPSAVSTLLDIIFLLSDRGIQFFLASHSYFVIKKLHLIALEKKVSIPVISGDEKGWCCSDLKEEMPDNQIINESIYLYEKEVELQWK